MAAALITVTGTFRQQDGVTPAAGTVSFVLTAELREPASALSYPPVPVVATLNASGRISVVLVATNDPSTMPTGVMYTVTEQITGAAIKTYNIVVPYNATLGTIDLTYAAPSSTQGSIFAVTTPIFTSHITSTTSVHGITDTSDLVYKSATQSITGAKTIVIGADRTSLFLDASGATGGGHTMVIKRHNDTGSALPTGWDVATHFNSQGALFTNAWVLISGALSATPDSEGIYRPVACSLTEPYMLGVRSDIVGPAIISRSLNAAGAYNYAAMDDSGSYVFAVEYTPEIKFGIGTRAQMDCRLYRTGVLNTPALNTNARLDVAAGGSYGGRLDLGGGVSGLLFMDGNLNSRMSWASDTGPSTYKSFQGDGGAAVGHIIDTAANYVTSGAKIVSIRTLNVEKNSIDRNGKLGSIALQAPPTISGSRAGNAALASLLTSLATAGVVVDSTTA